MNATATRAPRRYRVKLLNPHAFAPVGARRIVFHGINKSGSLAMANVLSAAYAEAGREAEVHSHYRGAAKSPEEFRRLIERSEGPGFFVGHYLYGAFYVPRASHVLITQFRHPLPRAVSIHRWLKRAADAKGESFPELEDWVRKGAGRSNSQIAQFALPHVPERGAVMQNLSIARLLEMAKENIERDVACVGIAEYFEESIFLFANLCGLERVPAWTRDERNRERPLVWDLPVATQALIREVMHADFELYEWALDRFFAQLRKASIAGDIEAYRADCAQEYKDRLVDRDPRTVAGRIERIGHRLGIFAR